MRKTKNNDEILQKKKNKSFSKRNVALTTLLLLMIGGVGTYAWFSVSNKARVENLALIADHAGNLRIADDLGNGPGEYSDVLNLNTATGHENMKNAVLSPVTTTDGKKFYAPVYNTLTQEVDTASEITNANELTKFYIYEKTFYLRAGADNANNVGQIKRTYDIALYGVNGARENGSYIKQQTGTNDSAANAIRISLTLEDGSTYIYEPNYDVSNGDKTSAVNNLSSNYGGYTTYQQRGTGGFRVSPKVNESEKLFTINENEDVKVTMRVWIEGTDEDCTNSIEADTIVGQIQFISTEKKS